MRGPGIARGRARLSELQQLKWLEKNGVSGLQGLKSLKKTQPLCRAQRHDPQNLRVFPQPVKPLPIKVRFGRAEGRPSEELLSEARRCARSQDFRSGETNLRRDIIEFSE